MGKLRSKGLTGLVSTDPRFYAADFSAHGLDMIMCQGDLRASTYYDVSQEDRTGVSINSIDPEGLTFEPAYNLEMVLKKNQAGDVRWTLQLRK